MVLWYFLPNYIAAGLAVLSSTPITGLGRRVNEARELGAIQLMELIGRGGMGEVYRARHRMLARPAAIKLIRSETLGGGDGSRVARRSGSTARRRPRAAALAAHDQPVRLRGDR